MSPSVPSTAPNKTPLGTPREPTEAFADAINARFHRSGSSLIPLTPNVEDPSPSPALSTPSLPSIPASSPLLSPPTSNSQSPTTLPLHPPTAFTSVAPSHLQTILSDKDALILDIRPHNAFSNARLPNALSLSVPSTLLKRPLFSLSKLAQMLPSPSARSRFIEWNSASKILVYDADSSALVEGCNLLGLMRKFRNEGFDSAKEICWVKGGFHAIWRERGDLVDRDPPPHEEEDDTEDLSVKKTASAPAGIPFPGPMGGVLRTKHLPKSAFTLSSTTSQRTSNATYIKSMHSEFPSQPFQSTVPSTPMISRADPFSLLPPVASATMSAPQSNAHQPGFVLRLPAGRGTTSRPLPGVVESDVSMTDSAPATASLKTPTDTDRQKHRFPQMADPLSLPTLSPQMSMYPGNTRPYHYSMPPAPTMAFNPFFDNIRQNLELARGAQGLGDPLYGSKGLEDDGIPLKLPRRIRRRVGELPFEWLREIARRSGKVHGGADDDESEGDDGVSPSDPSDMMETSELESMFSRARSPIRDPESSPDRRPSPSSRTSRSTSPTNSSAEDLTRALAMQFYRIELGEQRRLMGVMEHHSKESRIVAAGSTAVVAGKSRSAIGPATATGNTSIGVDVVPSPTRSISHSGGGVSQTRFNDSATQRLNTVTSVQQAGEKKTSRVGKGKERATESPTPASAGKLRTDKDDTAVQSPIFPYSITAGVEKGAKNRYRNIWPFEHARVRLLRKPCGSNDDDYMNASYVQPLGTTKRYIATQGPLPATFNDFWTLCWEQNVHVIVMLTREIESALVKCGKYWVDGTYGSMKLKLIQTSDTPEGERKRAESEKASGFFNIPSAKPPRTYRTGIHFNKAGEKSQNQKEVEDEDPHTIRRVFELSNSDYPDVPPRIVTQLQYLEWPDLNVPEDPRGILGLMWEMEELVEKGREEGDRRWGEGPLNSQQCHQFQSAAPSRGASVPVTMPRKVSPKRFDGMSSVSSANELDPLTGIAKNAIGNPPVLLHCSAGVGRTGGFIAVNAILDGIRREMRKRKLARGSSASSNSASTPAEAIRVDSRSSPKNMESQSRGSSSGGVAMEVDSSPSPPGAMSSMDITEDDGDESEAPALTMAVPVGHTQVHVPVAGFSGPLPLEVEEGTKGVKGRMEDRPGIIKASPDLVNEVRRATMLNKLESNASSSGAVHGSETGSESFGRGSASQSATTGSGSGSGVGSGTNSHFGSGTGSRTGSGHFSVSPVSSHTGSFTSLSLVAAKNQVGPGKAVIVPGVPDQDQQKLIRETGVAEPAVIARPALPHHASSNNSQSSLSSGMGAAVVKTAVSDVPKTVTVVAPSSPKTSRPHPHSHPNDTSSRLDEWRSEVLDSQAQDVSASETNRKSRSKAQAESSSRETSDESPSNGDDTVAFRRLTFDYMHPRPLHDDSSPPLLSAYDEPVRRVVEDMREQRMSLCQSLRQYVFVHRAIIEGSLMIVDEENVRDEEKSRNEEWKASIQTVLDGTERSLPPGTVPIELIAGTHKYGLDSSNAGRGNEDLGRAVSDVAGVPPTETQMMALTQVSPGRPKRGASPTELLHEGAKGEVRLTKRPSVKRKPRSSDEDSERAILPF